MGRQLEVIGVSCENCLGACCRGGAAMSLTSREAYMNRGKMALKRLIKERPYPQTVVIQTEGFDEHGQKIPVPATYDVPPHYGLYLLEEDCGHLTPDNRCDIYGSHDRPEACRKYEVGSRACLGARQAFGVSNEIQDEDTFKSVT